MKPILFALALMASCSKEQIEKPIESISMTQLRLVNDHANNYVETRLVVHFHNVTDPALIRQYKALPARQPFCDDMNDTLVTTIGKVCAADCGLK